VMSKVASNGIVNHCLGRTSRTEHLFRRGDLSLSPCEDPAWMFMSSR
jgi:hypothetical protein